MAVFSKLRQVGGTQPAPDAGAPDAPMRLGDSAQGTTNFNARAHVQSSRYRTLARKRDYYECRQHDFKRYDFDGRVLQYSAGVAATQPLISAEKMSTYIPLRNRRPSAPYRISRAIVSSFTSMVFGENRFPMARVAGDTDTQDFLQTLVRVGKLGSRMIRARNLGGSCGTSTWSWSYVNGRPRFEVHDAKNVIIHEWEDRSAHVPRYATECYQFRREVLDEATGRMVPQAYWYRRDFTPTEDVLYVPALVERGKDPAWQVDDARSVRHGDNLNHLVWVQNLPSEEDDGDADYEGLYEPFDTLDVTLSVVVRGCVLNLDPTLVIKGDRDFIARFGVKKGSDNALVVDKESGDAKYLELAGTSVDAGLKLANEQRRTILEVAECVLADADKLAAQGTSSVAQKMIFKPMLGKCDTLREQYGAGIERTLDGLITVARVASRSTVFVQKPGDDKPTEAKLTLDLPPRVERSPVLDADGLHTGEEKVRTIERHPGEGGDIDLEWPPYFPPTPQDQSMVASTLAAATAQQPFMSQQTATEVAMGYFGREGSDEWVRVQKQQKQLETRQASMFSDATGDMGGKVTHTAPLPGGGTIKRTAGGAPPKDPDGDVDSSPLDPGEKK